MLEWNRYRGFLTLGLSLSLYTVSAQSILVNPYLQNATPSSIHIMWETNTNNESVVQYGTTMSLDSTASGIAFNSLGGTIHHDVQLSGLQPGTLYYYQAITGEWKSPLWSFVTPALREDEASFNIALMSDMQRDNGNPAIFGDLINASLLPYIDSAYGSPLHDHLHMVLIPGDLVDNGNTFSQWKNHYFNPAEALWHEVPSYPAIGNHEANSPNYFNYFHLPDNGTPGYLEHWYAVDYSNVRVLGMDSNGPYRIQAQLDWLDSMLVLSCNDTLIDFVFAQMHHPHKSELWVPGEIDYTGDIIERLEAFSDSCGKPTIHFFGHTHAYSRGQSRDHDHVWLNVATAGGNIDYWGEFANEDYDEFVISEDEYGFVIAEITAGDDPKFVLRRLSFGDEFDPGGSAESDEMVVRLFNQTPSTPLPLFPLLSDTVSPLCVTLKADLFVDPDGDAHGSSHWQVSGDSTDFNAPVVDNWKQYQNWYDEVDLQSGDDLTDETIANLSSGQTYWWRVRYRDQSLGWSAWTIPIRFHTGETEILTGNLVSNPGAENGISSWTIDEGTIESLAALECAGINPYSGSRYFAVGALCVEYPFASAFQDIAVSSYSNLIDQGEVLVHFGGRLADWQNTDIPSFALQFLDENESVISGSDTIEHMQSAWTLKENTVAVPFNTRTIRFILMGTRTAGTDNDSYFDNLFLELLTGDFSCSQYVAPGPENNRLYVDIDASGVPNGESWTKAYRTLGDALLQSNSDTSIQEIWIAEGIYPVTSDDTRDTSFQISRSVKVYGGFSGIETHLSERNILANPVVLSGETGDPDAFDDNVYHVVMVSNNMDSIVLDGMTIASGNANDTGQSTGGGVFISETNLQPVVLQYCTLLDNHALSANAICNAAKLIIRESEIISDHNSTILWNSGPLAELIIENTNIHRCTGCPEAIENSGGAVIKVFENVEVEE